MKYKKIALALIMTLVLLPIPLLRAQETLPSPEEDQMDPAIMNMLKLQAMERKQEMFNFFGEGPYSPDTDNCMQNAQQAMEQAQNFEETNPQAAAQQYIRAMKQYRNALRKHLEDNPGLLDEFEEPSEPSSASEEIDTSTQEEINSAKKQLINRFQERYRIQVQAMIENFEELEDDLSPQDAEKARQALMHALEKTLRVQERIQSGKHDEALDDLYEATESLDQEFEELNDQDSSQMLKFMNRLEARIQKMIQIRNGKIDDGVDTSFEDEVLEELEGNKNEMKHIYQENNRNGGGQGSQGNQESQGNKGNGSN
ncbi:hypothetical protein ACFL0D_06065 [Thermoproteota archaeon]